MADCAERSTPCYCTALRRAARAVTKLYDAALEPGGLKVTQFSLLRNVQRLGPVTFAALSGVVQLERTTLIRNLDVLVRQGLLEMRPNPPSRAHLICLTHKGEAEIEKNNPAWEAAQNAMETVLTGEERRFLRSVLKKLQQV
ncbi:putative Multiple antibiotic resistance protein MarR [uncultured delta proteobacterium]|uniref:Putative Multiple antibiotic resistance protein MarR n=1 Tax=uncultured delta proteobacterium TaxID=34034 RepID=A0A212K7S0_9DELT|nr:putative Multiple antibiotic resistance protein MarR [uncultured delta proteobacterium]